MYSDKIIARLNSYIMKRGPDDCWPWMGARHDGKDGYGVITISDPTRKLCRVHVITWEIHNNRCVTPGLFVCHSCDNPPCCNPSHLWEGTPLQNAQDMMQKGRHVIREQVGEKNTNTDLTNTTAARIVDAIYAGYTNVEIAAVHGTTHHVVSLIRRRKTWLHIPRPDKEIVRIIKEKPPRPEPKPIRKLLADQVIPHYEAGLSLRAIAAIVGFSHISVRNRIAEIKISLGR